MVETYCLQVLKRHRWIIQKSIRHCHQLSISRYLRLPDRVWHATLKKGAISNKLVPLHCPYSQPFIHQSWSPNFIVYKKLISESKAPYPTSRTTFDPYLQHENRASISVRFIAPGIPENVCPLVFKHSHLV